LIGSRAFDSLAEFVAAARSGILIDGGPYILSLPSLGGVAPERAILVPADHRYGSSALVSGAEGWSASVGSGRYIIKATNGAGQVGESLLNLAPGVMRGFVSKWDYVIPGDCTLEVQLPPGGFGSDSESGQMDLFRDSGSRLLPVAQGSQSVDPADKTLQFEGLGPGDYRLCMTHADGAREWRSVTLSGNDVLEWGARRCVDVIVTISDASVGISDHWSSVGGRLFWRIEGSSIWHDATGSGGARSRGWLISSVPVNSRIEVVASGSDGEAGWLATGRVQTGSVRQRVELEAVPAALVSGCVLLGDRTPAAGIVVRLQYPTVANPWEEVLTDMLGSFCIVRRDEEADPPKLLLARRGGPAIKELVVAPESEDMQLYLPQ